MQNPTSNGQIAAKLLQIRKLMEFAGEPFFRFMAHERAAEAVVNSAPVAALIASGQLRTIPGVGKSIAAQIEELALTGSCAHLAQLSSLYPPHILELLDVPGVGMKTARMLFDSYGIASLEHLREALKSGSLAGAPRLGKKSLENLQRGVLASVARQKRTPLGRARTVAAEIMDFVRSGASVDRLTYAGSLRRQEATVGDVDIICTAPDAPAVIKRFVAFPSAGAVLAEGPTKASIWLSDGLQIDLRVLQDDVFGNLLQHFTGSREHNIQLREYAVRKGLRVSENGILDIASGKNITCRTEQEVYAALGMAWIAPEMRLGVGEIDAALDGSLPTVVELGDLRGDFHMHCTWSDGRNSLEGMVQAAAARGYAYHSISDHSISRGRWGLDPDEVRKQRAHAHELGEKYGVRTLCSTEVDILADGSLDFDDVLLAELDIVVASIHADMRLSREAMTARLIRACENRYVNIIGHPTGRQVDSFGGYDFDHDAVFAAAARTGTALEIDGQPVRLDLPGSVARRAKSFGVTFTCDSDAHGVEDLPNIEYAVGQARRGWLEPRDVLNTWPLDDVLAFVAAKRR